MLVFDLPMVPMPQLHKALQFFQILFFNEVSGPLKIVGVLLVLMAMVGVGVKSILYDRRKQNK